MPVVMNTLNTWYNRYNIAFVNDGNDQINDDRFTLNTFTNDLINDPTDYQNTQTVTLPLLFNTNLKSYAINIYLLDDHSDFVGGQAMNNPSNALVIGGIATYPDGTTAVIIPSTVVAHEVGHCLGLFHTFEDHPNGQSAPAQLELVNESNCSTAGDLVCDTNASIKAYNFSENSSCVFQAAALDANGQLYNPDPHNLMAYVRPSCYQYFSTGQVTRIKSTLNTASVLTSTIIPISQAFLISGSSLICANGTFTVSNPLVAPVTWSSSYPAGLSIDPSSGIATRLNSFSGPAIVNAAISGCAYNATMNFNVGVPAFTTVNLNGTPLDFGGTYANKYPNGVSNQINIGITNGSVHDYLFLYKNNFVNGQQFGTGTTSYYQFICKTNSPFEVEVDATNACGTNSAIIYLCNTNCPVGGIVFFSVSDISLSIYPNPASSSITVQIIDPASTTDLFYEVSIVDRNGKIVFSGESSDPSYNISVNNLASGTYVLNATYQNSLMQQNFVIVK